MGFAIDFNVCLAGLCCGLFGTGVCCLLNIIISAMRKITLAN